MPFSSESERGFKRKRHHTRKREKEGGVEISLSHETSPPLSNLQFGAFEVEFVIYNFELYPIVVFKSFMMFTMSQNVVWPASSLNPKSRAHKIITRSGLNPNPSDNTAAKGKSLATFFGASATLRTF